jgi:3-hydroxyisobutyrate dehydrogenase-like beta-hydroxyacid dehydrogenase
VTTPARRVAFLGLGRMGLPMAANLAGAGHDVVVWNRSTEVAEQFVRDHGGRVATSPADAAAGADLVLSMLADDEVVLHVHTGDGGTLSSVADGAVVIDLSTVTTATSARLADAVRQAGARFLDAPVSGSVAAATAGELTVMVGGDDETYAVAEPVLTALGTPLHLGANGVGAAMKLAVNTVVHGLNGALSEALVLAERSGIDRELAYDVFSRSAVAAPFVHYRRDAFERPDEVPAMFRLELAAKDLTYALQLATDVGAELPQSEQSLAVLQEAVGAGFADHDESAVAQHLRTRARENSR